MHTTMELVSHLKRNILSAIMPACDEMSLVMDVGVFGAFTVVGLYGLYLVLFSLAIWSTYQEPSIVSSRMRILACLMCFIVTVHTAVEIANFCIWRPPQDATLPQLPMKFYVMPIIEKLTPCFAGLLSDGFLAWRCYVIWGRRRWMKWVLPTLVVSNSALGLFSNIAYGPRFKLVRDDQFQASNSTASSQHASHEADTATYIMLAWAWWFLLVNTAMTLSIIGRISYASALEKKAEHPSPYPTVIRAIIESALISWIGLLAYNVPYVLPSKHSVTQMASVCSDTLYALLPLVFAISQALIIARLGMSRFVATVMGHPSMAPSLAGAMAGPTPSDFETGIVIERRGGREKGHWSTSSMDVDAIHRELRAL